MAVEYVKKHQKESNFPTWEELNKLRDYQIPTTKQ